VSKLTPEKFKTIGGHPCLDFVNTVSGRVPTRDAKDIAGYTIIRDKFLKYIDLLSWAQKVKLISDEEIEMLRKLAEKDERSADAVLVRAVRLREALYRIVKSIVEDRDPGGDDLGLLNEELRIGRQHEHLDHRDKRFELRVEEVESSLDSLLWLVSRSAADLLRSERLERVRQCPGDECWWLFLDESRNHTRQWCDMRECGNRAKVRRFRADKRANI